MEQASRHGNALSFIKYRIATSKKKLNFDFKLNSLKYSNRSSKLIKSDKKLGSFKFQSHSIIKDLKYSQKVLRHEELSFIKQKELTPLPGKSNLIIDTSPSPKLRFRVRLPILKKFDESSEVLKIPEKPIESTLSLKETYSANQETQTDPPLKNFPNKPNKVLLESKNLIENLEIFPQTPTPRFQLKKLRKFKKLNKNLKDLLTTLPN